MLAPSDIHRDRQRTAQPEVVHYRGTYWHRL